MCRGFSSVLKVAAAAVVVSIRPAAKASDVDDRSVTFNIGSERTSRGKHRPTQNLPLPQEDDGGRKARLEKRFSFQYLSRSLSQPDTNTRASAHTYAHCVPFSTVFHFYSRSFKRRWQQDRIFLPHYAYLEYYSGAVVALGNNGVKSSCALENLKKSWNFVGSPAGHSLFLLVPITVLYIFRTMHVLSTSICSDNPQKGKGWKRIFLTSFYSHLCVSRTSHFYVLFSRIQIIFHHTIVSFPCHFFFLPQYHFSSICIRALLVKRKMCELMSKSEKSYFQWNNVRV